MTTTEHDLKAGRRHVARSRGALSGTLLVVLGAWTALVPFIAPYLDIGFTPRPDDSWHWTGGRGLYQVLPGGAAVLAGVLLMLSASRAVTLVAGWLGAVAGAWLVVGPVLADVVGVSAGRPDPASGPKTQDAATLLQFFGIGVVIVFVASLALGRLSVHSVRDVRAAERRAEAEAEQERLAEQRRAAEAEAAERDREAAAAREQDEQRRSAQERSAATPQPQNVQDRHADPGEPAAPATAADRAARTGPAGPGDSDSGPRHAAHGTTDAPAPAYDAPPASTPPASTPPASTPPASTPPASTPPASTPPASKPPASAPPGQAPPWHDAPHEPPRI